MKYKFDSFKLSDETQIAYSMEFSDGVKNYFASFYNDYEIADFIEKESIGCNGVNGVYIYTMENGKKCIVGVPYSDLCENCYECFDSFERITKNNKEFLVLKKKDKLGKVKYGVREVWYGRCLSSIIFDRLDFNLTEEPKCHFKAGVNEEILAVGYLAKPKSQWIISNFGVRQIKPNR